MSITRSSVERWFASAAQYPDHLYQPRYDLYPVYLLSQMQVEPLFEVTCLLLRSCDR
jgi:hypothetical protein